jgi:hypothetical protein
MRLFYVCPAMNYSNIKPAKRHEPDAFNGISLLQDIAISHLQFTQPVKALQRPEQKSMQNP